MQRPHGLPHTDPECNADLELSSRKASCKSHCSLPTKLCSSEVDYDLLNYANALSLSIIEFVNVPLADSLSPVSR